MPRNQICRRIGGYPDHWSFAASDADPEDVLTMNLDEYESIRLIDREGLTQEQCARRMGVARTTVTNIYESARKKLAEALIDGKTLRISGGNYCLERQGAEHVRPKGANQTRIAISYENGAVFQHFGHTEQFKLYDVDSGAVVGTQLVACGGSGHGLLVGYLKEAEVDAVICGGIGMGAQMALAEAGIKLYAGIQGHADEAAKALAEDRLACDPEARCDRRERHDGDCGRDHCAEVKTE